MSQYIPKPYEPFDGDINVKLDLSNYTTKTEQYIRIIYFKGKNHFEEDGTQNYLVFQPMYKYFKKIDNTDNILEEKSTGLSDEIIKTLHNTLAPELIYSGKRMYVKFNGSCLKQDKITFNNEKIGEHVHCLCFKINS